MAGLSQNVRWSVRCRPILFWERHFAVGIVYIELDVGEGLEIVIQLNQSLGFFGSDIAFGSSRNLISGGIKMTSMTIYDKIKFTSAAICLATCASFANASVITSLAGGSSITFPSSNLFTAGPVVEPGYTYTSSYGSSVFGYTGGYGLSSNGNWTGAVGAYLGLNTGFGWSRITFDNPVASVLAFVNYAAIGNGYDGGVASIAAYDSSDTLIESFNLSWSTVGLNQGFDYGFSEASATIKSIQFNNAYVVATNLRTSDQGNSVPEPGSLALAGLAIAGLAMRKRRKSA